MAEMIEKKALLDDLKEIKELLVSQGDPILASVLNRAIACVEKQPVADAVEVVHGRCKKSENREEWYTYEYACFECGATMMVADVDGYDIAPNFCPNCGAKMDGERKDNGI